MYMYVHEHVWVFIFWLLVFHVYIEKEKKVNTKKEISGKSQNFIELLPNARPPPEIKTLSDLVKISWKTEIELFP